MGGCLTTVQAGNPCEPLTRNKENGQPSIARLLGRGRGDEKVDPHPACISYGFSGATSRWGEMAHRGYGHAETRGPGGLAEQGQHRPARLHRSSQGTAPGPLPPSPTRPWSLRNSTNALVLTLP